MRVKALGDTGEGMARKIFSPVGRGKKSTNEKNTM